MSNSKKITPFIPAIAREILTRLKNANRGIDDICADDFNLDLLTFEAELHRMHDAGLIVNPVQKPDDYSLNAFDRITGTDIKVRVAITNIGEQWLKNYESAVESCTASHP
jgi:hypothetical protein